MRNLLKVNFLKGFFVVAALVAQLCFYVCRLIAYLRGEAIEP